MRIRKNVYLNFDKKSIDMENENKDKNIILTDEELKKVAGGYGEDYASSVCKQFNMRECAKHFFCKWENGHCIKS